MPSQKEDAVSVLGEESEELIEELERLARRARTKSQTDAGMVLKSDDQADRKAALAKIKELRRKLDTIEKELTDGGDFARKWGNDNQPEPKQHRVRVWDTGEGGRLS